MRIFFVMILMFSAGCGSGVSSDPKVVCQDKLDNAITAITECGCNVPDSIL